MPLKISLGRRIRARPEGQIGCNSQGFWPLQGAAVGSQLLASLPSAGIVLWAYGSVGTRICSSGRKFGERGPSSQIRGTAKGSFGRSRGEHRMPTPATSLGPKANAGLRPESHRYPSILAALWVGGGALGVGVVACLLTVMCVHQNLEALRGELSQLREELRSQRRRDGETLRPPQEERELLTSWALQERPWTSLERRKRDLRKTPREPTRPRRKQSVLHLVPVRQSSSGEEDVTEIWWKSFLHQGRALELSGQDVIVKHSGLYFIYSQVLFHDHTFTMGQELRRLGPEGQDQTLFRCIQSMPAKLELAYNSCYSGGIFHLQQGDRVNLRIPRFNASFILSPHGTFFGLLRL